MKRFLVISLALLGTAAFAQSLPTKIKPAAPIKDFRLPMFNEEGKRIRFLRAGEALFVSPTRIDVKDMHLTEFTKDGTGAFDTVLLAPSATFLEDKKIASGNESVRLIRVNVEVTGEQWSYNHLEQRVKIEKNAKVTFQDELSDIIK
ncbi:MAG: hypothetical protein ABW223_09655 [Rariglobus sp.]